MTNLTKSSCGQYMLNGHIQYGLLKNFLHRLSTHNCDLLLLLSNCLRYARVCSLHEDFLHTGSILVSKVFRRGYSAHFVI